MLGGSNEGSDGAAVGFVDGFRLGDVNGIYDGVRQGVLMSEEFTITTEFTSSTINET